MRSLLCCRQSMYIFHNRNLSSPDGKNVPATSIGANRHSTKGEDLLLYLKIVFLAAYQLLSEWFVVYATKLQKRRQEQKCNRVASKMK